MKCKSVISTVISVLSQTLTGVTVKPEFPGTMQNLPLRAPVITVGIGGMQIQSTEENGAIATGSSACTLTLHLSFCVPKDFSGTVCHTYIDDIVNALGGVVSEYSVTDIVSGGIKYSSALSALVFEIDVTVSYGDAF